MPINILCGTRASDSLIHKRSFLFVRVGEELVMSSLSLALKYLYAAGREGWSPSEKEELSVVVVGERERERKLHRQQNCVTSTIHLILSIYHLKRVFSIEFASSSFTSCWFECFYILKIVTFLLYALLSFPLQHFCLIHLYLLLLFNFILSCKIIRH